MEISGTNLIFNKKMTILFSLFFLGRITKLSLTTLHIPILIEISVLVVAIILCVFELIVTDNYSKSYFSVRLSLIFCVLTEIGIFSMFGQQLQDKSSGVSEKIYATDWPMFFYSYGKDGKFLMMITAMRSRRAEVLTAGGFMKLNLGTFMSVSAHIFGMISHLS